MKKTILLMAAATAIVCGCSRDPLTGDRADGIRSIQATVGQAQSRAGDADIATTDPTMSPLSARDNHTMTVTVAGTAKNYIYGASGWVPAVAGDPARFPANAPSAISIELTRSDVTSQDGTVRGLLDADALEWGRTSLSPVQNLAGVVMTHSRSLIELDATGFDVTAVEANGAAAYRIPSTDTWQVIATPGATTVAMEVTIAGQAQTIDVPVAGGLLANTRYRMGLTAMGVRLTLTLLSMEQWSAGGNGTATKTTGTVFIIECPVPVTAAAAKVVVTPGGPETNAAGVTFTSSAGTTIVSVPVSATPGVVTSLTATIGGGDKTFAIGRAEGSRVYLTLDAGGNLAARTDAGGSTLVNTAAELDNARNGLSGEYLQQSDLDLRGIANWTPVGINETPFTGAYDGGGYTIDNMTVSGGSYLGLFGYSSGALRNIRLGAGCSVAGTDSLIGGVCGVNYNGTVTGCANAGAVEGAGAIIGGVCGGNSGTIENCTNAATVKTTSTNYNHLGGVCGNNRGTITGCANTGAVEGAGLNIGGVCGYNQSSTATVEDCTNAATVKATSTNYNYLGGVCGDNEQGTITGCANTGAVEGKGIIIGGVCGDNYQGTVTGCANTGAVEGAGDCIGGVCGYNSDGTVGNCTNAATVKATRENDTNSLGGVCGYNSGTVTGCDNLAAGAVEGAGLNIGGVCGYNTGSTATVGNCTNAATVKATATGEDRLGGICGFNDNYATVTGCGNTGEVTGAGTNIGGICGANAAKVGTCTNAAKTVATKAGGDYNSLGGICGWNTGTGTLTACANTGEITGAGTNIGGVCGYNNGTAENCSNAGSVKATHADAENNLGGVCGINAGTVTGCDNLAAGAVEGAGLNIGGVCGQNSGLAAKVEACSNAGNVASTYIGGDNSLGGVCGYNYGGTVTACRNTGNVTGAGTNIGGVCGYLRNNGSLTACYTTGKVTGLADVFHLALIDPDYPGTIQHCYWVAHTGTGTPTMDCNEPVTDCFEFSATHWPGNGTATAAFNAANGWGEWDGTLPRPAGCYWYGMGGFTAGPGGTPLYPILWKDRPVTP